MDPILDRIKLRMRTTIRKNTKSGMIHSAILRRNDACSTAVLHLLSARTTYMVLPT